MEHLGIDVDVGGCLHAVLRRATRRGLPSLPPPEKMAVPGTACDKTTVAQCLDDNFRHVCDEEKKKASPASPGDTGKLEAITGQAN